jgi:hypothetical protein
MFGGVRIIESLAMIDQVEDWSRVRSPGRARRRRRNHPQNIRMIHVPKPHAISMDGGRTLIMHPETVRQLREMTKDLLPEPSQPSVPERPFPVPLFDRMGLSVVQPFPLFNPAVVA